MPPARADLIRRPTSAGPAGPPPRMDALEALYGRQSVGVHRPDPVPRDVIEALLAAASQAPDHYHERPWRFVVFTGEGRRKLGQAIADSTHRCYPEVPAPALAAERAKPLKSPLAIAVGQAPPQHEHLQEIESICAVACAVQNLLIAAHAFGLASHWKNGADGDPEFKRAIGLRPAQRLIALVYLGYPLAPLPIPPRPGFADRTTWVE
ncbi:MAG: nitroreductase [Anaerolineales bacterium]|nr:nitroreductase [Anaerolineales bacterium]